MTSLDQAIRSHMDSAAKLMHLALQELRREDPDGANVLAVAYMAGGMLQLRSTVAHSGIAFFAVELIEPGGRVHTVSTCELQREVRG